jgi:hypothetical protein
MSYLQVRGAVTPAKPFSQQETMVVRQSVSHLQNPRFQGLDQAWLKILRAASRNGNDGSVTARCIKKAMSSVTGLHFNFTQKKILKALTRIYGADLSCHITNGPGNYARFSVEAVCQLLLVIPSARGYREFLISYTKRLERALEANRSAYHRHNANCQVQSCLRHDLTRERKELLMRCGIVSHQNQFDKENYKFLFPGYQSAAAASRDVEAQLHGTVHASITPRSQSRLNFLTGIDNDAIENAINDPNVSDDNALASIQRVARLRKSAVRHVLLAVNPSSPDFNKLVSAASQFKKVRIPVERIDELGNEYVVCPSTPLR